VAMKPTAYAILALLLAGAIGGLSVRLWSDSQRIVPSSSEDVIQVDIISAEGLKGVRGPSKEKVDALFRSLQQRLDTSRAQKESIAEPEPPRAIVVLSDSPVQFVIESGQVFEVKFPPGRKVVARVDSGKALFLVDDERSLCFEGAASATPKRNLLVTSCDNGRTRLIAFAADQSTKQKD
jgi:hypothetical protein